MSQNLGKAPATQAATDASASEAAAFIQRWHGVTASELSTSQSFVIQLCALLGVEPPHPTPEQSYMFERPITFQHGDGSTSAGRVDCYKRGHFVWESKKLKLAKTAGVADPQTPHTAPVTTKAFDDALLRARQQAENYARALPAAEGRPPFVVVVDVGHVIELYAEFTRSGATYTPFPDPRSHRIRLQQLADPAIRARLKALWTDPLSLDPSRVSARVTRAVAAELAELAKSLEAAGHAPQAVAAFLTRCLFSMFAEDVGLLPKVQSSVRAEPVEAQGSFVHLLKTYREQPATLAQMLKVFWAGMDVGGFNVAIAADVLRFNGKLFKGAGADGYVLPLTTTQIDGLLRAARANWQEVEPAIFGTLLERALDPTERHALGAHYTPRAYVERLVLPTVVEPLRADWANAQAAAVLLARDADAFTDAKDGKKREAKLQEARAEIRRFHHQLCTTRVLDPACGSGNFLYVTLEHLKRLEGEVMNQLEALGETQVRLGLEGETVTLQQLRGIELNERAAALAELVLWIGWLQWHVRTRGLASVAEPVVHDYGNIENRDAVLAYDRAEPALDAQGKPITRWDGVTFKKHPVTGEDVPDEAAQMVQWKYLNPRPAEWPAADFIVGNPPFIGAKYLRDALGDGYAQALRATWPEVPESADFVMYWWHHAASQVRAGHARRFGFITTNSLRQTFNRRVIEAHLNAPKNPLTLAFAVPDHPWVDSAQGAAVRIAMSVGTCASVRAEPVEAPLGRLLTVVGERTTEDDEVDVQLEEQAGFLHADLRIGANVSSASPLVANLGISSPGVKLHGAGFIVTREEATALRWLPLAGEGGAEGTPAKAPLIREYRNGRDLMATPRDVLVIDAFGLSAAQLRERFPAVYQWVLERVKPERDQNNRATYRDHWWLFGEPRKDLRPALHGLSRYIVTAVTAKHRVFQFLGEDVLADDALMCIGAEDASVLGVLSSQVHVEWMLATGSRLGIGNDPRYIKSTCFEKFPFPSDDTGLTPALTERIRQLAEQLDAHRKVRQAAFDTVTLTGLYNVLDKLRRGEPLSPKEKLLHEQGLVSVLQSLHDELDAAVLEAYGWRDLGAVPWADEAARAAWTESLLERLVALNARRAAEEAGTLPGSPPGGTIRWLRPEFQDPARRVAAAAPQPEQTGIEGMETEAGATAQALRQAQGERSGAQDEPRWAQGERGDALADEDSAAKASAAGTAASASPWPSTLPEQVRAVAQLLGASPAPLPLAAIEAAFKGKGPWKKGLPRILETLEALGRARREGAGWRG
ncbi:MAG: SAM-dependent methyltransferase [Betaproteobacteria bacterium HGW-Betaproteobacteria-3]|nr:MAG: SAM-dependent methyltransferase [Betaproteobacteria bacterium HGW-Betaproteobacteria-3]